MGKENKRMKIMTFDTHLMTFHHSISLRILHSDVPFKFKITSDGNMNTKIYSIKNIIQII